MQTLGRHWPGLLQTTRLKVYKWAKFVLMIGTYRRTNNKRSHNTQTPIPSQVKTSSKDLNNPSYFNRITPTILSLLINSRIMLQNSSHKRVLRPSGWPICLKTVQILTYMRKTIKAITQVLKISTKQKESLTQSNSTSSNNT